jgi:hypothetical protein
MADYDLVEGTIIMMAAIALSLVLVVGAGAIMDKLDYMLYTTDPGTHANFVAVGHMVHDWYFSLIGLFVLIVLVWYVKLITKKLGYNRLEQWG